MNREIDEIFKQWKQFLSWCYENNDKTTEIHRDDLERVMVYTRQLENIIKEVREYIEHKASIRECYMINGNEYKDILAILDKGE